MIAKKSTMLLGLLVFVTAAFFLTTHTAHAAPIDNFPVTVTQPDGTVIHLLASGDEFYNWLHDENGYTVMQDPGTGYYVYADLVNGELIPTNSIVGRTDPASAGLKPYLNISPEQRGAIQQAFLVQTEQMAGDIENAPHTGTINNLVIFIRFSGESEFTVPTSTYTDMLNSSTAGVNSLRNYFREVSYNVLTVNSTLLPTPGSTIVSYQDSHPRAYYQPYNSVTNPIGYTGNERALREHTLLRDAINYVNNLGQFPSATAIDGDGDGIVDSLTFVVSGGPDGWNELLWPHAWGLFTYNVTIRGKAVDGYQFQLQSAIHTGVLAHETFHVLGAPDLYHYTDNGIQPVGGWDLMEFDANPPQHMGCYMKFKYGNWISSIPELTSIGTYSLNPLTSATNNCFKIASPNSTTEYFVVEYRNGAGSTFENSLPGNGLLVYRINTQTTGNAGGPPDEVYVYRPGGTTSVNGDVNLAYFSSNAGRTVINDSTNPSSFLSNGGAGGLSLCNIGASNATISFDLCNIIVDPSPIFDDNFESCDLSAWSPNVIDGGDLSAGSPGLAGNCSMRALIDDNNVIYVTSSHPNAESRYLASFYFDPNSIAMVNGDTHTIFGGYTGTSTLALRVQFRKSSGNYQLQASLLNDGSSFTNSSWFTISDASHQIEFDWRSSTATGANNGELTFWIDGVERANLTGVDNDTRRIDNARLGAIAGIDTGTRGTYYFDEFESSRGNSQSTATLTVTKTGSGSGTVTSAPAGINCGSDCSESYSLGMNVELTATADPGSTFTGWSDGGCSGITCVVTLSGDTTVNANFTTGQPDLIIQSITPVPANPSVNQTVDFSVVIKNQGSADATGFWMDLFIDTPFPTDCSGASPVAQHIPSLAAGVTQTLTLNYSGFGSEGVHTVNGIIDTNCNAIESNENNNTKSINITVAPPPDDHIFGDGFESCNLSAWSPNVTDGGDLSAGTPGLAGSCSMRALIDDNVALYVTDTNPIAEPHYRARFYFHPNSIGMASGDLHNIFVGLTSSGANVFTIQLSNNTGTNSGYRIRTQVFNDSGNATNGTYFGISNASHFIEIDWQAATAAGANDGYITLWIDGVQKYTSPGIDSDTRRVEDVRWGATAGIDAGTRGTYYFDAFEARRQTYIGPAEPPSNTAPVVSAGPDQTIALPGNASLDGTVSDDGLPNPPGTVTTTWSKVNGPGTVTFDDPDAADTTANFSVDGNYTLRLTADDGALSSSDDIIIMVNPVGSNVAVVGAFTADGNWSQKATFVPGDTIQWVLEVQNDTGQDAQIELTFDVRGPNGEQLEFWNGTVTTAPGAQWWGLPGTVQSGYDGTHTLYGSGLYQGNLSQASSTYTVSDDVIFADSFEADDCTLSMWSSCVHDNFDLSFNAPSLVLGNQSMNTLIDDNNALYVTSDHPNAEARYRARFYFDPNSIPMASGNAHFIFYGYNGTSKAVVRVEFRNSSGNYQLRAALLTDGSSWNNSTWFNIGDTPHPVEIDWRASTGAGANNGGLTLWIDGTQKANLTGIDNDTWRIDRIRLGAVAGIDNGTRGTYYFDAFESRRQSYIGPMTSPAHSPPEPGPVLPVETPITDNTIVETNN